MSLTCFSQGDYVILGDSLQMYGDVRNYGKGKILQDDGVWHTVAGEPEGNIFSFDWVTEYRRGDDVYKALTINGNRQMYHELVAGKTSLYKYGKHYVLKTDTQTIELNKRNYQSVLLKSLLCNGAAKSISNVAFSKLAMQRVVAGSNDGSCNLDYVSYPKFGIIGGYNRVNVTIFPTQFNRSQGGANAFSLGVFYEAPLPTKRPWLSFHAETYVNLPYNVEAEYSQLELFQVRYFTMTYQSVVVSPGFKLTTTDGSIKPYLKLAPALSFTHCQSRDGVKVRGTDVKVVDIGPQDYMQAGFSTSAGFQFPVGHRRNILVELKHTTSNRNQRAVYEMHSTSTSLWIGFSL